MRLLEYTPCFDVEAAVAIAEEEFGIRASARQLRSERDQNFLLTDASGEQSVLKFANALEEREFETSGNPRLILPASCACFFGGGHRHSSSSDRSDSPGAASPLSPGRATRRGQATPAGFAKRSRPQAGPVGPRARSLRSPGSTSRFSLGSGEWEPHTE